jgi:hypothetical protein
MCQLILTSRLSGALVGMVCRVLAVAVVAHGAEVVPMIVVVGNGAATVAQAARPPDWDFQGDDGFGAVPV